jgi:hypothetical protein
VANAVERAYILGSGVAPAANTIFVTFTEILGLRSTERGEFVLPKNAAPIVVPPREATTSPHPAFIVIPTACLHELGIFARTAYNLHGLCRLFVFELSMLT